MSIPTFTVYKQDRDGHPLILPVVLDKWALEDPLDFWRAMLTVVEHGHPSVCMRALHLELERAIFECFVPDEEPDVDAYRVRVKWLLEDVRRKHCPPQKVVPA